MPSPQPRGFGAANDLGCRLLASQAVEELGVDQHSVARYRPRCRSAAPAPRRAGATTRLIGSSYLLRELKVALVVRREPKIAPVP